MDSVTAEIKLMLRIKAQSRWGKGCTLEQVEKQALESVMQQLSNALNLDRYNIKLITQPECLSMVIREPLSMDLPIKKSFYLKTTELLIQFKKLLSGDK